MTVFYMLIKLVPIQLHILFAHFRMFSQDVVRDIHLWSVCTDKTKRQSWSARISPEAKTAQWQCYLLVHHSGQNPAAVHVSQLWLNDQELSFVIKCVTELPPPPDTFCPLAAHKLQQVLQTSGQYIGGINNDVSHPGRSVPFPPVSVARPAAFKRMRSRCCVLLPL